MDESLRAIVHTQLDATQAADAEWAVLVLAALGAPGELAALLEGNAQPAASPSAARSPDRPAVAYLADITVEGFRGVGQAARLELTPGPGLTLVVGRNGSGKSSFAEALEVALTGKTFRWQDRSAVWRKAWRNLRHRVAQVQARFLLDGERGPCTVSRRWAEGAELEDAVTEVQIHGKPRTTLDALGWSAALETYRPLLFYAELGALLDEQPSALFDAMASMLGLDDLVDGQRTPLEARLSREGSGRKLLELGTGSWLAFAALTMRVPELPRPQLPGRTRTSMRLEQVVAGGNDAARESGLETLRRLATLEAPDLDQVAQTVQELREASAALRASTGTAASRARQAADLLELALRYHAEHGDGDCPVCGQPGALDDRWRTSTLGQCGESCLTNRVR
jgi:hypothetical protein